MADDPPEDSEHSAKASQQEVQKVEMTTEFDPSLRTDKRILGSVVAFFLLVTAVSGYSSGEYSVFVTGSLLAFAVVVILFVFLHDALRDAW
jgi:hypothetical protein